MMRDSSLARASASLLAAALLAVVALAGCAAPSAGGAGAQPPSGAAAPQPGGGPSAVRAPGDWFTARAGDLVPIEAPSDAAAPFAPWTAQTRIADFLELDGTLYLALNGWGLLSAPVAEPFTPAAHESRALFGDRTINGLYASGERVVVHLYHNTLFGGPEPEPPPISVVFYDPTAGALRGEPLPLTKLGWEAVDVVHRQDGQWYLAWKLNGGDRVEFRYTAYSPGDGSERTISRSAFVDAYGFRSIDSAPRPLQLIARAISADAGASTVVHLTVRGADSDWNARFSLGPESRLATGDAELVSVPVVQSGGAFWALAPGGRLLIADSGMTAPARLKLPALPTGYAYTAFWTDGVTLFAAWEQQRFTEVGAAGLVVRGVAPQPAGAAEPGGAQAGGPPLPGMR